MSNKRMSIDKIYNTIIIDTNALDAKKNDFCGYYGRTLPSFFNAIKERKLVLLSHPVLKGETIKHIRNGNLGEKVSNAIIALGKHKMVLERTGISLDDIIRKLGNVDLCDETIKKFEEFTKDAIMLPYTNPEEIFHRYFDNKPPFAESGNKKSEFPDAFVIESVREYIEDNKDSSLLVVSEDGDWKKYFSGMANVYVVDNIESALIELYEHDQNIAQIIETIYAEIETEIVDVTRDVWFSVYDYECNEDELEIEDVKLIDLDERYVPLSINEDTIIIQTKANLAVDGYVTVLDTDNSIWDSEERDYVIRKYALLSFERATTSVICEIEIDISGEPKLKSMKYASSHGACLDVYEGNIEVNPIDDEADAYADMMDTLEDRYWH